MATRMGNQVDEANEKVVYFWSEPVKLGGVAYDVTMASSRQGLCWLNIGEQGSEEKDLQTWVKKHLPGWELNKNQEMNSQAVTEFQEYLRGERTEFSVPLHRIGTDFQIKVWQELSRIPYGITCSYGDIAEQIGCHGGQRAVGLANGKNPIGIVVPCHRVIGKNGSLTGYAGGLDKKALLLELEAQHRVY